MTEDEKLELQMAEEVCRKFLACNLEGEDVIDAKEILTQVLGRSEDVDNEEVLE